MDSDFLPACAFPTPFGWVCIPPSQGRPTGGWTAPRAGMVLVFPFMEGFCFDAGSLCGAAGPTNGRLVSVALFTLIVNPQHDRSPLQAHLVCETASPSRLILHEIRLFARRLRQRSRASAPGGRGRKGQLYKQIGQLKVELDFLKKRS